MNQITTSTKNSNSMINCSVVVYASFFKSKYTYIIAKKIKKKNHHTFTLHVLKKVMSENILTVDPICIQFNILYHII